MKIFSDYAVRSATLWRNVKYRRLLPGLRSDYAFACEKPLLDRGSKRQCGVKRVFYNETRGDGSGFAEHYNMRGKLRYISFFDTGGKCIADMWVDFTHNDWF